MKKKYIVRLSDQERQELRMVIKKLSGTSQKGRHAQILLKSDADGPAWTDAKIAEAFGCRIKTVENIRQRLVENGFRETLDGKKRSNLGRRIGTAKELRDETSAWATDVTETQRGVDWQMKIDDARIKLKSVYPKIKL